MRNGRYAALTSSRTAFLQPSRPERGLKPTPSACPGTPHGPSGLPFGDGLDDMVSLKVKTEAMRGHEFRGKRHYDEGKTQTKVP